MSPDPPMGLFSLKGNSAVPYIDYQRQYVSV